MFMGIADIDFKIEWVVLVKVDSQLTQLQIFMHLLHLILKQSHIFILKIFWEKMDVCCKQLILRAKLRNISMHPERPMVTYQSAEENFYKIMLFSHQSKKQSEIIAVYRP